jgi:hypothetical protein
VSISDAAVRAYFLEVSRDDRFVAAQDLDEILTLYPLDGGSPIPLPELGKGRRTCRVDQRRSALGKGAS